MKLFYWILLWQLIFNIEFDYIDTLGRGYDLTKWSPLPNNIEAIDLMKNRVFSFSPGKNKTLKGENYTIPDEVSILSIPYRGFSTNVVEIDSLDSLLKAMEGSLSFSFDTGKAFGTDSVAIGFNSQINEMAKSTENQEYSYVYTLSKITAWKISFLPFSKIYLDPIFKRDVERLSINATDSKYMELLNNYGTHYTVKVVLGGSWYNSKIFIKSKIKSLKESGINIEQNSKANFYVDITQNYSYTKNNKEYEEFSNSYESSTNHLIGGDTSLNENYEKWVNSVADNCAPIYFEMYPLYQLLRVDYFPSDSKIVQKQGILKTKIQEYLQMNKTNCPNKCSNHGVCNVKGSLYKIFYCICDSGWGDNDCSQSQPVIIKADNCNTNSQTWMMNITKGTYLRNIKIDSKTGNIQYMSCLDSEINFFSSDIIIISFNISKIPNTADRSKNETASCPLGYYLTGINVNSAVNSLLFGQITCEKGGSFLYNQKNCQIQDTCSTFYYGVGINVAGTSNPILMKCCAATIPKLGFLLNHENSDS